MQLLKSHSVLRSAKEILQKESFAPMGDQATQSGRMTKIKSKNPDLGDFLEQKTRELQGVEVHSGAGANILNEVYTRISRSAPSIREDATEWFNDAITAAMAGQELGESQADQVDLGAGAPDAQPRAGGLRPMAIPAEQATQDPCGAFPDNANDINSIFAHLNDVIAAKVPSFGIRALTQLNSQERAACKSIGISESWLNARRDVRHIDFLQNELAGGMYQIFSVKDYEATNGSFFADFFHKFSDMLPARAKDMLSQKSVSRNNVVHPSRYMNEGLPDQNEILGRSLVCHFANLLQQDNPSVTAFTFRKIIDEKRREMGVNRQNVNEGELDAASMGAGGLETMRDTRAINVNAPDYLAGEDDVDEGAEIANFIAEQSRHPEEAAIDDGSLQILKTFMQEASVLLNQNIADIQASIQSLQNGVGANVGHRRHAQWAEILSLMQKYDQQAVDAKDRALRLIGSLVHHAERGFARPALLKLQSILKNHKTKFVAKSGHMVAIIEASSDADGNKINISRSFIKVNTRNAPTEYLDFAPGQLSHEFGRYRIKEERQKGEAGLDEASKFVCQLFENSQDLSEAEVYQLFVDSIDMPLKAGYFRKAIRRAKGRWPQKPKVYSEKLHQALIDFEASTIDRNQFLLVLQGATDEDKNNMGSAIKQRVGELSEECSGGGYDTARRAGRAIGSALADAEKDQIINAKQLVQLIRYFDTYQGYRKDFRQRTQGVTASIRDVMLKMARRLFLA